MPRASRNRDSASSQALATHLSGRALSCLPLSMDWPVRILVPPMVFPCGGLRQSEAEFSRRQNGANSCKLLSGVQILGGSSLRNYPVRFALCGGASLRPGTNRQLDNSKDADICLTTYTAKCSGIFPGGIMKPGHGVRCEKCNRHTENSRRRSRGQSAGGLCYSRDGVRPGEGETVREGGGRAKRVTEAGKGG